MAASTTTPLLSAEEIAVRAGQQVRFLRTPERAELFAERALRLRQCAAGHAMREFLIFMAELAEAQHAVLQAGQAVPLPTAAELDAAARAGRPPLPAVNWPRDAAWRGMLRALLQRLLPRLADSPAQAAAQAALALDDDALERQADCLLANVMHGLDLASAPFVAAALQVYWTQLVLATEAARGPTQAAPFGRTDDATLCPCCGSRPTASIERIDPQAGGYRYLHCALCSAQWHMVRIKCSHCEGTKGIQYHALQAADAPDAGGGRGAVVEAETCEVCGHYLKVVHMARDPQADPVADDLASVTLDLLVSEAGFQRHGVNLMLLFGDPDGGPGGGAG